MFNFRHKDDVFFDWFVESGNFFHRGALLLHEVMLDYGLAEAKLKEMIDLEHDADDLNDQIVDKLNQTFITPIDREDIYALANKLDDGVDFQQGTLQRIVLYRTGPAREGTIELSQLVVEGTEELNKIFLLMKDIKRNHRKILDHTRRIEKLESEGDRLYRKEVAYLFEACVDPIEIIKWKEILEYLENTLDHCEDVSDLIRGVVMKYA